MYTEELNFKLKSILHRKAAKLCQNRSEMLSAPVRSLAAAILDHL